MATLLPHQLWQTLGASCCSCCCLLSFWSSSNGGHFASCICCQCCPSPPLYSPSSSTASSLSCCLCWPFLADFARLLCIAFSLPPAHSRCLLRCRALCCHLALLFQLAHTEATPAFAWLQLQLPPFPLSLPPSLYSLSSI